ncbi:hypothetical protein ACHAWX_002039 [Stephanocyclus meneghinianus]
MPFCDLLPRKIYLHFIDVILLISIVHVFSLTLQPEQRGVHHLSAFDGVGITSVLPVPNTFQSNEPNSNSNVNIEFYVGTKRGKVKHVVIPKIFIDGLSSTKQLRDTDSIKVHDVTSSSIAKMTFGREVTLKPYPVYSMTVVPKPAVEKSMFLTDEESTSTAAADYFVHYDVLAGGGDRYIKVWESATNSRGNQRQLKLKQQLGPHTGWVKDIASFNRVKKGTTDGHSLVFSIGCNCIEVWLHDQANYQHLCKLQIESCTKLGATLSSDLLCLATYRCCVNEHVMDSLPQANQQSHSHLIAGGVDGRLHSWVIPKSFHGFNKSTNGFVNAGVTAAHSGRINDILVCNQIGALVTVGSDGCVTCRMISSSKPFDEWETSCIDMTDVVVPAGSSIKLTSSCIVVEEATQVIAAVGSSTGNLFLIRISKVDTDNLKLSLLTRFHIYNLRVDAHYCIHSLCCFEYCCSFRESCSHVIAVGHSNGLSLCLLSLGTEAISTR